MSSKAVLKSSFMGYIYRGLRAFGIILTIAGLYQVGFIVYYSLSGGKALASISRLQAVCVLQGTGAMSHVVVAEIECGEAESKRAQYPGVPLTVGEITYGNFSFTAEDGSRHEVRAPLLALEAQGAEHGTVVSIAYARDNPEVIRPAMPLGALLRALSMISGGVAILFAVLTLRWIASHRRGIELDVATLETGHTNHVRRNLRLPVATIAERAQAAPRQRR